MKKENWRLGEVVRVKEEEMRQEVEKLRRFKELLERRNYVHEGDLEKVRGLAMTEQNVMGGEREELWNLNPFKTIALTRYPEIK